MGIAAAQLGCSNILGEDQEFFPGACTIGDRRCAGPVQQVCNRRFEWENDVECAGASPVCTPDACLGVKQVAAGNSHACAVLTNGSLRCWGRNNNGQIGDGTKIDRLQPTVVPIDAKVEAVALGGSDDEGFTCALLEDRTVQCWGDNYAHQLGSGVGEYTSPHPVPIPSLGDVVALSLGWKHACALLTDGTLKCWGGNAFFQGGAMDLLIDEPTTIQGLAGVIEVAAGTTHTCARTKDSVVCWGSNKYGQCGQPPGGSVFPPKVVLGLSAPVKVASGKFQSCAITALPGKTAGPLLCWGRNDCAQLGSGAICGKKCDPAGEGCPVAELQSVSFDGDPAFDVTNDVALGTSHGCLRQGLGLNRIYCWGRNDFVQAGTSFGTTVDQGTPFVATPMPTPLLRAATLSAGAYHTCAIIDNEPGEPLDNLESEETRLRDVRCWGRNDSGQLGNGTTDTGQVVSVKWQ